MIWIEVICDQTGDSAEAEDEASAIVAARTLCEDAVRARRIYGFKPSCTFLVNGVPVRSRVPEPRFWVAV